VDNVGDGDGDFQGSEIVTVKALEKVTVKARIRMVRYCFNDAVRLVVMGYVDW
jgi:hypothetical protein